MSQLYFKPISVQIGAFPEMRDSFKIGNLNICIRQIVFVL